MRLRKWLGGYVRRESDGAETFVIEREVSGRRFHVSTRCNSERSALKQLERFEADPANYSPGGRAEESLHLDDDLIIEFHVWSTSPKPKGRGNSEGHAREMSHRLRDWRDALQGVDLRRATLRDHIAPPLDDWRGTQHRIIAIKSFYAWLRKVRRLLTSAQDPTLDLPVPQGSPEKHRRRKAVDWETVEATFAFLPEAYRDLLQLLAATGWHVTEAERFIRGGTVEHPPRPVKAKDGRPVLGVLVVRHKSGGETRTPVMEAAHLAAAEALQARGTVPRRLNATLADACRAAGVPVFTSGVMRHSVATWAVELGADKKEASEFLGHANQSTTDRFYLDLKVPTATVPTRVLRLVPKAG